MKKIPFMWFYVKKVLACGLKPLLIVYKVIVFVVAENLSSGKVEMEKFEINKVIFH